MSKIIAIGSLRVIVGVLSLILAVLITHSFWGITIIAGGIIGLYMIFLEEKLLKYFEK